MNIGQLTYPVKSSMVVSMKSRKREILVATRSVLIRDGSAGFSVRKVAQEAGISIGNLQYHYSSRVTLLREMLTADIEESRQWLQQMVSGYEPGSEDGRERLRRFMLGALAEGKSQEELAVFRALFSFSEPEIITALDQFYGELFNLLTEGLAVLSGNTEDSVPVKQAATLLFPFLDGYDTTSILLPLAPGETAELMTDILWDILVRPID